MPASSGSTRNPDFNTPNEATGGYFDGMGVAILASQCWHRLAATVPGFQPLQLFNLAYCGIRDFDPGQREKVERHRIRAVFGSAGSPVDFPGRLDARLAGLPMRVMVHLDLDCLDTSVGRANQYAAPGGPGAADLVACMLRIGTRARPLALTIASFDPDLHGSDAIATAVIDAARALASGLH